MKPVGFQPANAARAIVAAAFALSAMILPAGSAGAEKAAPPKSRAAGSITAVEARALADWALARPEVASRFQGARTRLLHAGIPEAAKDGKAAPGRQALLAFRDYDTGVVRLVTVDLESGRVGVKETARLVQPNLEEISDAMAIVLADPRLAAFSANPALILQGGFHVKGPHDDDPCSREVCLEFAFMQRDLEPTPVPEEKRKAPRRVIVNLSRGAVVNLDYRANADAGAPLPRMTAAEDGR
ncbi:MAG: hypothetical protein ABR576_15955 [Thermoanaerobaculia bacterium]